MNANTAEVTLQINLAPSDLPHAQYIVPHQLRQWGDQVSEVVFVVDLNKGHGPRFAQWQERLPGLRRLVGQLCETHRNARWLDVDYSPETARGLADAIFGGHEVPLKDWNGTAVYPYYFGIYAAAHDYVFHLDSDMMFGGGSRTWVAEAVELLRERPDVLACNPLPGPPRADGNLTSQSLEREPLDSLAYRARELSTRLFLMDRSRLYERVAPIALTQPPRHRRWQAIAEGRPPYDLAEVMLTRALDASGLIRIDFLGRSPGVWSIHPPYRSQRFYEMLPRLLELVETGAVPDAQRGDHDLGESMIDWSDAHRTFRMRARQHADLLIHNAATQIARARGSASG